MITSRLGVRLALTVLALAASAGILAQDAREKAADTEFEERAAIRADALAKIRNEIGRLENRLAGLDDRAASLESRLERTETLLSLQEERLAEATAEREWAEARLAETADRVKALKDSLTAVRDDLARRLGGIYRLGRGGYLRVAARLDSNAPTLPALRRLRYLANRDNQALERYRRTRGALEIERQTLDTRRGEALVWQQTEAERRASLASARAEQARLLAALERERRTVKERTSALEGKAQKLTTLIGALLDASREPLDGRPMMGFRGVLDWPVKGEIQVPFGPRRDPRYRTEVPHNGIDLATESGASVRTVYPGKVLYAAPFEGFGETVVVHHPGQIYSLYAGLLTVRVNRDDVLRSETVIGTASTSLYFEIRRQNQPEDPLAWLR